MTCSPESFDDVHYQAILAGKADPARGQIIPMWPKGDERVRFTRARKSTVPWVMNSLSLTLWTH